MVKRHEAVTIKDIARMTGFSVATVSQVINGNGHASEATQNLILKCVEETGYIPNTIARSLRKKQDDAVAILLPDISNEFYAQMAKGIQDELYALGRNCVIFNTKYDATVEEHCLDLIVADHVKAIIAINTIQVDVCRLPSDCVVVYIDSCPVSDESNARYIYYHADHEQGAYLATQELIRKGCRNLLMITCKTGEPATEKRRSGFRRACAEHGLSSELSFEADPGDYNEGAQKVIRRLFDKNISFDGVFAQNDIIATGVLAQMLISGISVPEQVKIVGFDDTSFAKYSALPITTIHQPIQEMGREAAKTVLHLAGNSTSHGRNKIFPVELVLRSTT